METHPGEHFLYRKKRKFEVIPIINLPKGSMCRIKDLDLDNKALSTHVTDMRESYAKFALLMFHPYWKREDILLNSNYWEKLIMSDSCGAKKKKQCFGNKTFKFCRMLMTE